MEDVTGMGGEIGIETVDETGTEEETVDVIEIEEIETGEEMG